MKMLTNLYLVSFQITFFILLSRYSTPAYGDGYIYSSHAIAVAIVIAMSPIAALIIVAVKEILKTSGSLKQVSMS